MGKEGIKGQMNISFGMIFSIILIIIFLAFGFYAITKFLDLQKSIQVEKFLSDLQSDIDQMWKSPQGSQTITYILPMNIISVCFKTDKYQNLEFNSEKLIGGGNIENIDLANMTSQENPYCIPNIKGKVSLILKKDYGETLVRITR